MALSTKCMTVMCISRLNLEVCYFSKTLRPSLCVGASPGSAPGTLGVS